MRAGGMAGWCWTGKKVARKGSASEAMPGYYKKTLSGEVTEMRAGGTTGWCWVRKRRCSRPGERSDAGLWQEVTAGEVTEMRAGGMAGWCWAGKKAVQQAGERSEAGGDCRAKEILRAPHIFLR